MQHLQGMHCNHKQSASIPGYLASSVASARAALFDRQGEIVVLDAYALSARLCHTVRGLHSAYNRLYTMPEH